MKKIAAFLYIVCCGGQSAMAQPKRYDLPVLRARANEYSLVGEGLVFTKDCTVTAEGTLTGRIVRGLGKKSWLVFRDRQGRPEAECEIKFTVTEARTPGRDLVAVTFK